MYARLLLCSALLVGCGPAGYSGPASLAPPEGNASPDGIPIMQPAPPPDERNAGQVVVDILAQAGYSCTAEESRWECRPPTDAGWSLYVSYVPEENGATTIWYDSYEWRAFAQPCGRFVDAMNDLANQTQAFSASCDDKVQQFRFNTAVAYGSELDVTGWASNHLNQRTNARRLLDSIGAIRR